MTEEEAKTKWCPFSRVIEKDVDGSTRSRNRVVVLDEAGTPVKEISANLAGAQCLGSACMAWRQLVGGGWGTVDGTNERVPMGGGVIAGHGYCGLAGAPRL